MFSNTFAGIAPSSAPVYIAAQVVGGILAVGLVKVLYPDLTAGAAAEVMLPHDHSGNEEPSQSAAADDGAAATASRSAGPARS
jgi:glycerol uptake facilitator-like aquaporin